MPAGCRHYFFTAGDEPSVALDFRILAFRLAHPGCRLRSRQRASDGVGFTSGSSSIVSSARRLTIILPDCFRKDERLFLRVEIDHNKIAGLDLLRRDKV